ncbi:7661_t:CDS:1, partial [Racocetra fulgida]
HCNFQYVSSKSFAKYMTKYIMKPERSELFELSEHNAYRSHVLARRLGTIELTILLLGYSICQSSIAVQYLPSLPPNIKTRSVKPIYLLNDDNSNPYWDDAIDKYFSRPNDPIFHNITYPQFHQLYRIQPNPPNSNTTYWIDLQRRYVIKRKKSILVRFHHLTADDGEPYFYQQLLLQLPWRNEQELLDQYPDYRSHYQSKFPEQYAISIQYL